MRGVLCLLYSAFVVVCDDVFVWSKGCPWRVAIELCVVGVVLVYRGCASNCGASKCRFGVVNILLFVCDWRSWFVFGVC